MIEASYCLFHTFGSKQSPAKCQSDSLLGRCPYKNLLTETSTSCETKNEASTSSRQTFYDSPALRIEKDTTMQVLKATATKLSRKENCTTTRML